MTTPAQSPVSACRGSSPGAAWIDSAHWVAAWVQETEREADVGRPRCAHGAWFSHSGATRTVREGASAGQAKRLGEIFRELSERWREDTKVLSSVEEIVLHPCYQRIIGLGRDVLPYLIRELEAKPDHWFWALGAITGADPVPPEHRGRVPEMAKAWIAWARGQGLRW